MSNRTGNLLRKLTASLLKRYYILTSGGYSVGTAYGGRFLFDWRHSLDKKVAVELYERDLIDYFCQMLDSVQPDLFLDIGAHAALYSIIVKTRSPDTEVHAFEPDRNNLCQLYANLFVNQLYDRIAVHEHGISNTSGTVSFNNSDTTSSRGTRRIASDGNTTIKVMRLDDVLSTSDRVAMLKIDVEGHELAVIEGAGEFLSTNRCLLQIESSGAELNVLIDKMSALGYRYVKDLGDHYFSNIPDLAS